MNREWNPSGSLLLLQVTVLIVGCSVIASSWRVSDRADARNQQLLAEQRRFHTESITALSQLATNAGLLSSADLCPVRFRLRSGGGHSVPRLADGEADFRLWAWSETGRETVMESQMDRAGTIDFGLNPPGDYQLELRMPDGMFLVHEFDVLPGVPIDRLVCCPQTAIPGDVSIQLDFDWDAALQEKGLVPIYLIEPAPFVDGEWHWHPPAHWEPLYVVAGVGASDRIGEIAGAIKVPEWGLTTEDEILLPYLYCQIRQVTLLANDSTLTADTRLTNVVTARFGDLDPTEDNQTITVGPTTHLGMRPLHFTTAQQHCRIEIPQLLVEMLR